MRTRSFTIFSSLLVTFGSSSAYAYEEVTHEHLTRRALEFVRVPLDARLKALGLPDGMATTLQTAPPMSPLGPCSPGNDSVRSWIVRGSCEEDRDIGPDLTPGGQLVFQLRILNHFHDPISDGGLVPTSATANLLAVFIAGLANGSTVYVAPTSLYGRSSEAWGDMQTHTQWSILGDYWNMSLDDARKYLYLGVTSQTALSRNHYLALALKALGHEAHLLQDASVPSHVRNDGHASCPPRLQWLCDLVPALQNQSAFHPDTWAHGFMKRFPQLAWIRTEAQPIFPEGSDPQNFGIFRAFSVLMDQELYAGLNPDVTIGPGAIGLSEYTQANYFSDDTFEDYREPFDSRAPNPHVEVLQSPSGTPVHAAYSRLPRTGTDHLRREGFLSVVAGATPGPWTRIATIDDPFVHDDYKEKLIPRAIGYSTALIESFFRGELVVTQTAVDTVTLTNPTIEDMDGTFSLYYETVAGTRMPVPGGPWLANMQLAALSTTANLTVPPAPSDAADPGRFVLVFKGKLGWEQDAVVATKFGEGCAIAEAHGCSGTEAWSPMQGSCVPSAQLKVYSNGSGTGAKYIFPEACSKSCGPSCIEYRMPSGDEAQFLSEADSGWFPGDITGDCIDGSEGFGSVVMDSDKVCTQNFVKGNVLRVTTGGAGSGGVVPLDFAGGSSTSESCGDHCIDYTFMPGTQLYVQAYADEGSGFVGWSGACQGIRRYCELTLNGDVTVGAEFGPGGSGRFCTDYHPTGEVVYYCDTVFHVAPCGLYLVYASITQADDAPGYGKYTAATLFTMMPGPGDHEAGLAGITMLAAMPEPDPGSLLSPMYDNQLVPQVTMTYRLPGADQDSVATVQSCL